MVRVSAIIPAYNAARFIGAALESVQAQTYTHWEAIVVNDGSRDNTGEIVESFVPAFGSRLRHIVQENRGLPAARNAGIRHAEGEFIALLDSDDLWLPQRLERGVQVLDQRAEVGLVHAKQVRIDVHGNVLNSPPQQDTRYLSGNIARNIMTRRAHLLCPTIIFRKSCIAAVGYFDEHMRATEDRDMWFRIAEKFEVAYINEVLAFYRISPNQMTSDLPRLLTGQQQFIQKHRERGACSPLDARIALAQAYREQGDEFLRLRHWPESLSWYARSVSKYPFSAANLYMFFRALADPFFRAYAPGMGQGT
jgi:glycosyltransferase involved in cell wall biosynthesis